MAVEMVIQFVGDDDGLRGRGRDGGGGGGNRVIDDQDIEGELGGVRKGTYPQAKPQILWDAQGCRWQCGRNVFFS